MFTKLIQEKNVKDLVKIHFNIDLRPSQIEIVRIIAFSEHRKLCVNAMTRYGKTMSCAIGICLYIWFNNNKKIFIIAPQEEQAGILRNFIAGFIIKSRWLRELVDIERDSSIERLKKEASRKRWTFKNGCELRTISAHGESNRLMGMGGNMIVIDEAALISRDSYARITRMLGDDPENSVLIELSNPWTMDCKYYDHYVSGEFHTIHVGYEKAIEENATTLDFINSERLEHDKLYFTVFYESNFPTESENQLISFKHIQVAENQAWNLSKGKKIISVDVADSGNDFTVIYWGLEYNGFYEVKYVYYEGKSENMRVAERVYNLFLDKGADVINVDGNGVGVGVVSRLKDLCKDKKVSVVGCMSGGRAGLENSSKDGKKRMSEKKLYVNKKAETYFKLKHLFESSSVRIPKFDRIRSDLISLQWERSESTSKVKILKPENKKSPDFADALMFFVWKSDTPSFFFA